VEKKTKLYRCSNNGVVAIVTEETMALIEARLQLMRESSDPDRTFVPYPHRIHTFSSRSHLKGWVNGTPRLLDWLIEQSGAEVANAGFYVPFSNGAEFLYRTEPERAEEEWRFRTSGDELLADFGLREVAND